MGLDKEKFIASAKAAGYTDDEIKAELGDSSPATVSSDKETAKNEAEFAAKTAKEKQQYEENVGASQKTKFQLGDFSVEMPSSVATPLKAVGEGLLVAGAYQGVKKGAELGKDLYNKVHGSLRDFMSTKDEGLFAAQQAEKPVAQPLTEGTPKEISAKATPATNVDVTSNVGKPLQPIEKTMVEQGAANTQLKAAEAEVKAAEKTAAQIAAQAPEGWKPNYTKSAKNPIGPGAFNYLASQYGPEEAAKMWEQQYGKKNVPYSEFEKDWSAAKRPALPVAEGAKPGGSIGKPTYVPEYIRGSISPAAALNLAGNALGAAELMKAYQHGKKTGDWSDLGLGAVNQVVANVAPKAALLLALMSPTPVSSGTLDSPEAKELFKRIKEKQGIAPPMK